jgi:hypothetical protein
MPPAERGRVEDDLVRGDAKGDVCSICLDEMSEPVRLLACGHRYHDECIRDWDARLALDRARFRCAMCRSEGPSPFGRTVEILDIPGEIRAADLGTSNGWAANPAANAAMATIIVMFLCLVSLACFIVARL